MNKKHWKITLISILITSTLFNTPNETVANTSDDIDESDQEENNIDDPSADDDEVNTDDSYEDENIPEEESPEVPLYEEAEVRAFEDVEVLLPADPVGEGDSGGLQEEPTAEETITPEVTEPEDDALDEESEAAGDENGSSGEQPGEATPPVNEEENTQEDEGEEILEGQEPGEGDPSENELPVQPEGPDESGQPSQEQPEQDDFYESDEEMDDQPELPTEEAGPEASDENYEYYGEPAEELPVQTYNRDAEEYAGEDADGEASEEKRSNVAGKKLYRYNYGDILNGLNFRPGNSDESLARLDQRVNRIMTSKILEEDEMSEEEIFSLEQEIKNETSNTSSDRESLPNTGEANNYNYLYSLMLVIAGGTLFFITKRPRQQ